MPGIISSNRRACCDPVGVACSVSSCENYRPKEPRPAGFDLASFDFEHHLDEFGKRFAVSDPNNLEFMTAYATNLIEEYADQAGLRFRGAPTLGHWSASSDTWVGAQDLIVLEKL